MTEDPIKDGLQWYAYVGDNPVVFVDPLGLMGQSECMDEGLPHGVDAVTKPAALSRLEQAALSEQFQPSALPSRVSEYWGVVLRVYRHPDSPRSRGPEGGVQQEYTGLDIIAIYEAGEQVARFAGVQSYVNFPDEDQSPSDYTLADEQAFWAQRGGRSPSIHYNETEVIGHQKRR